jgi:hypothetical protein
MGTLQYQFPTEDAAKRFVKALVYQYSDIACMRLGATVYMVDGTHLHSRDILHVAALFNGHPV